MEYFHKSMSKSLHLETSIWYSTAQSADDPLIRLITNGQMLTDSLCNAYVQSDQFWCVWNKCVGPPYCWAKMYSSHIAYAPWWVTLSIPMEQTDRQTDRRRHSRRTSVHSAAATWLSCIILSRLACCRHSSRVSLSCSLAATSTSNAAFWASVTCVTRALFNSDISLCQQHNPTSIATVPNYYYYYYQQCTDFF